MRFRYAQRRVTALTRNVQPTNSSTVISWPPATEERPRKNRILINLAGANKGIIQLKSNG